MKKVDRILVIDDDESVRNLFVECLNTEYRVLHAGDGEEAVAIVRREPELHLLITDLFMPKQEGVETIQEVRALRPGLRIMAPESSTGHLRRHPRMSTPPGIV